jgi:tetratricopeptide (TPR) repeat protein
LSAQFLAAQARAASFEQSGDLLTAWREYRQVAATFDAIADIAPLRSKAADLEKAKAVREAIKREKNDFEEQQRLGSEVLAAFSGTESDDSSPAESADRAVSHARDLRLRAANEKKPDRALVFRRALAGVFVGAMESGGEALDKKDYRRAARQFACAAEANPESEWAFRNLAVAQALEGERRAALQTLRSTKKIAKDAASFSGWLKEESAFDRLRSSTEFQAILTSSADAP